MRSPKAARAVAEESLDLYRFMSFGGFIGDAMNLKGITWLLLLCLSLCSSYGLEEEEDMELERQLKLINKTPLKTIQTAYGDVIDCIDIHKQLAFDHPLLKNHKIQMRPSFSFPLKGVTNEASSMANQIRVGLKSKGCPTGTVPIRRTRKEDLQRSKTFASIHPDTREVPGSLESTNTLKGFDSPPVTEILFATLETLKPTNESDRLHGAKAHINVYNPRGAADQTSSGQMWVENGPFVNSNSKQAGWILSPPLYGDYRTHLFTAWTADGYHKTGCWNILCPGFVQVDKEVYLGEAFNNTSVYNGVQYDMMVHIYQDQATGNWWLVYTTDNIHVGYWPKSIFTDLAKGASKVSWGGRTSGAPEATSAEMGSGYLPDGNYHHACYFRQIQFVNASYVLQDPDKYRTREIIDKPDCYDLKYYGDQGGVMGHTFLFGGPGGNCGS
ncbi:hypothetical protein HHK36_028525 [Tetracentron sinense]|uniref:Neprosin PEP catalytic domain-containing protein n=1 Tax=Tetracentron sinense TaxID=13715 RepID=A0A834YFJ2_TETSI|nr:hypothetical protein HHK36_028525 [Tetracentron sinense]